MHKYTKQELDRMSIFDVRHIAKEVGVSAPTKLNKAELMDLIYKISNGLMAPPTPPRVGRPKKFTGADSSNSEPKNVEPKTGNVAEKKQEYKPSFDPSAPRKPYVRKPYDGNVRERRDTRQRTDFNFEFKSVITDEVQDLNEFGSTSAFREDREFTREGYLEINPDNYGFLRVKSGECCELDAYVSSSKIRQFGLRRGDYVVALCRKGQDENKPAPLYDVISVNGDTVENAKARPNFDTLTPVYPQTRLRLEVSNQPREYAMRCIDLVSPVGKGQRAIIVSPPKAGKTTLLKMIAGSISKNYPDVVLKVLLIDERPEEVTDMQRSIKGEVVYSTFDELPEHHTKTAEMLLERSKRLVENGKDVVILLDSLTRLARAYNLTIPPTGRTLSGGIDPGALHSPKRFFGSARNLEANPEKNYKGGSLTIIATALVETGSRMDDVIFEEFKGTGNMEIHLDRKLSEKRIFPAIDLAKSSTRKEELLLTSSELEAAWGIRKMLSNTDNAEATENLINMIVKTSSNKEFIDQLNLQIRIGQKEGYTFRSLKRSE
ncbi:MAG: transcription termination factor Rho [Bacteroides sp.]|nr:transcription termination factor Rho [Bacillota bacterium]MCM1393717.1 transcription termination factor Rho [[Eubacterium] siraeum]MCM1455368.1 transcription termination factor Rho [Bacteroides sp.]